MTKALIEAHPLRSEEIVEVTLTAWNDVFASSIGRKPLHIGVELFPRPQIMSFFLHELVALEFARRYPSDWRREMTADEKDVVYIPNPMFSVEIKASSSADKVFGNRSYTQQTQSNKKLKAGYYLTINFESFVELKTVKKVKQRIVRPNPRITLIRFGWLDQYDWMGQQAASGQQARLSPEAYKYKLLTLFPDS